MILGIPGGCSTSLIDLSARSRRSGQKPMTRDAFELKLTGDVRHDGANSAGFTARWPFLTPRSASGRYGTGNPLEKIANTGHIGRRRRRHPADVG